MDATFKICPYGDFTQLLFIYIEYVESTIPFIFVLMNRKTTDSYTCVFEYINENIFRLDCQSSLTDYELAMRNALRNCFPASTLYACWFHFCQAVKKHANQIRGFVHDLKMLGNENALDIYCKFLCLPLLPAEAIVGTFNELKAEANNCNKRLFQRFLYYFETQWIRQEGPMNISVYQRMSRTTNALEAYNGALGRKIDKKGNFFIFLGVLLNEEYIKSHEFDVLVRSGGQTGAKKRKRLRESRIENATDQYNRQIITADMFLKQVTFKAKDRSLLISFEKVGVNMDDIPDCVVNPPIESEENSVPSQPGPSSLNPPRPRSPDHCGICLVEKKTVLFACMHLITCEVCYRELIRIARSKPRPRVARKHPLLIECPYCRTMCDVTKCQVIFNV